MNTQDLIDALRSASVDQLALIRSMLRIPDPAYGSVQDCKPIKNLGDLWNRTEQKVESKKS